MLFLIHYQFSNSNYNYLVSGSRLKNSRITADVNWPLCLKNVGSCLSTHWFFFLFLVFSFFFLFFTFFFYSNTSSTQHTPTGKSSTVACLNFTQLCYTHPPRNNQIHDSLAKKKLTIRARKSNNFKWFTAVNFEPTRFNLADLTWFHMKCRFSLGYR